MSHGCCGMLCYVLNMILTLLAMFSNFKQLQNGEIGLYKYNNEHLIGIFIIFVNFIYIGLHVLHFMKIVKK
jgi:hypothetical protein